MGSLLVTENNRVIGIATTSDIFITILNPLLGIGMGGSRIVVIGAHKGPDIERVLGALNKLNVEVTNLFVAEFPKANKHDLFIHLGVEDASAAARKLKLWVFRWW